MNGNTDAQKKKEFIGDKPSDQNKKEMLLEEAKKRFSFTWFVNTPQKRTYTLLGVTFITFALLMWFAVKPTIVTILELNRKIKTFKETSQELDLKYQNLLRLNDQYQKSISEGGYKEAIEFFDGYALPNTDEVPILIANINQYSIISNVTLKMVHAGEVKNETNIKVLPFEITVEGSLESINSFISRLEGFPRPIKITSINISSASAENAVYSASIAIEAPSYISNIEGLDNTSER